MGEIALFGMPVALLVVLLVQGLKALGLPDKWSPWAALVMSLMGAVAVGGLKAYPAWTPVVSAVVSGLVVWLMATGIYHAGKNAMQLDGMSNEGTAS